LANRTLEHLTSMDNQVIYVRRRLLRAAKDLVAGVEPEAPFHPEGYRYHGEMVVADTGDAAISMSIQRSGERRANVMQPPKIAV